MAAIRRLAQCEHLPVEEWIRWTVHDTLSRQHVNEPGIKLEAVRRCAEYSLPTADITEMLNEIAKDNQG